MAAGFETRLLQSEAPEDTLSKINQELFALTGVLIGLPEAGDDVIKELDGLRLGRVGDVVDHRQRSVLDPELRQQIRHPAKGTNI